MKNLFFFLQVFFWAFSLKAQLVPCRPKICLIDYHQHNDNVPNPDLTDIQNLKPDILIDNTPNGLYGSVDVNTQCLAPLYTSLGVQVYSYITSAYETYDLDANFAFIDGIASDQATGVFLDNVHNYPTTAQQDYINSIYTRCQLHGLKLILNPGTSSFDSWLMDHCDYLLSDEHYDGVRAPSASELPYRERIIVVNEGVQNVQDAIAVTSGAQSNGFGYSYACTQYIALPAWLQEYGNLITQSPPPAPIINLNGTTLEANSPLSVQWYENTTGLISGANSQTFTPSLSGTYYAVATNGLCNSEPSNSITVTLNTNSFDEGQSVAVTPNPSEGFIKITSGKPSLRYSLTFYDSLGTLVKSKANVSDGEQIDVRDLSQGMYILKLKTLQFTANTKIVIRH